MGYYYTTEPENAVPAKSCAQPKTHTPGSPVKERGFRYYQPDVGRWASRDPAEEMGGLNVYIFISNEPTMFVDLLGLKNCTSTSVSWLLDGGGGFSGGKGSVDVFGITLNGQAFLSGSKKTCDTCCPWGPDTESELALSGGANFSVDEYPAWKPFPGINAGFFVSAGISFTASLSVKKNIGCDKCMHAHGAGTGSFWAGGKLRLYKSPGGFVDIYGTLQGQGSVTLGMDCDYCYAQGGNPLPCQMYLQVCGAIHAEATLIVWQIKVTKAWDKQGCMPKVPLGSFSI